MLERFDIVEIVDVFCSLDVVLPKQRRHRPATPVLCIEEADLDHDAARIGLR
jgi:hypothetical protein